MQLTCWTEVELWLSKVFIDFIGHGDLCAGGGLKCALVRDTQFWINVVKQQGKSITTKCCYL